MKKLIAASIAVVAAAPAVAQQADPFVSTQVSAVPAIVIIGGVAAIIAIAASSGVDSSSGTN